MGEYIRSGFENPAFVTSLVKLHCQVVEENY